MYAASSSSMLRFMCASQAACTGVIGCLNALAGFLYASCRPGLTACTLCMATCMRPVCPPCFDSCTSPACMYWCSWPLEYPCWLLVRFLQGWLDCMYALHGYMYVASLSSMLRYMYVSRGTCIGFPGCLNALAGFLYASCRPGLTACTPCTPARELVYFKRLPLCL